MEDNNRIICKICGAEEDADHWGDNLKSELMEHQMCFHCNFWRNNYENDEHRKFAIVNGTHYVLRENNANSYFKGFGGAKFVFKFNDGHIEECNNVWYQGNIPDGYWREFMPDNAEIVEKDSDAENNFKPGNLTAKIFDSFK